MLYAITLWITFGVIVISWLLIALYSSNKLKAKREYRRRRNGAIKGHNDYINEQAAYFYVNEPEDCEYSGDSED